MRITSLCSTWRRGLGLRALGCALILQAWSCSSEDGNKQVPTVTAPADNASSGAAPGSTRPGLGPGASTTGGVGPAQPGDTSRGPAGTSTGESPDQQSSSSPTTSTSTQSSSHPGTSSTSGASTDTSTTTDSSTDSTGEPPPPPLKRYTEGHGDIAVYFDEAKDDLRIAIDVEDSLIDGVYTTKEFAVNELLIRTAGTFVRPAEDTDGLLAGVCVDVNQSIGWLPQNNTDCHRLKTPFLGWANRIRPRDLEGEFMSIRITGVDAPAPGGHLSVWRSVFPPEFMVSTCDGLQGDEVKLYSGHDHYNIGFAGPKGRWTGHFEVELTMATTKKTYKKAFSVEFLVE